MNVPAHIYVTVSSQPLLAYNQNDSNGNRTASITVTQFTFEPVPEGFEQLSDNIAPSLKIVGPNHIDQLSLERLQEIVTAISNRDYNLTSSHVFSSDNCVYSVIRERAEFSGAFNNPMPLFQLATQDLRIRAYDREYSYTFPSADQSSFSDWAILATQSYLEFDIVE